VSDEQTESPAREAIHVVGIGASAGGLEALDTFFEAMPADSGMAFVVIQHLSPDYKSMMVELLSKRTRMPVRRAEEGMLVEANTVYLIPPRKQLTIFHRRLMLHDQDAARGLNLPIDVFLQSLAVDHGEQALAIILSGTGSDGVRGIRAIKEAGGMVLVQQEDTARFDGMPKSAINTGLVDLILPPEAMPDKLLALANRRVITPVEHALNVLSEDEGITRVFAMLREQTKVDFTLYKPSTILRRLERRLAVRQCAELKDYLRLLEEEPSELTALYRDLLIGVTSFFRDREVWEELLNTHLPPLFENAPQGEIRFWVAGCSTGEEAYTLAILARECMDRLKRQIPVKVFATDLDRQAIITAGAGLYPESIAADVPQPYLSKYFVKRDEQYQVHHSLREMVVFAQHNLLKDPPFTNLTLASCRNLLIYLQPVLQQKVMDFLNFGLNSGGILVLGSSETPGESGEFFLPLNTKLKQYKSRGRKRTLETLHAFQADRAPRLQPSRTNRFAGGLSPRQEDRVQERLLQALAEELVPLVAVVNERMELLHVLGESEGLFRLPTGLQSNDVTRMVAKELAAPLISGLQRVFQTGTELKYTSVRVPVRGETRTFEMRIRPLTGRKGQEPLAAVFIEEAVRIQGASEVALGSVLHFDASEEAQQRISDLEQELQFTRENLQATIEELETSNEELQATNEELLASNEELQSTNEELQSVNEELHTVNAEYHTKMFEVTETANDLENLFAITRIATLFLDENLQIRRFTPELERIYRILPTDLGRPIAHITHKLVGLDPLEEIQRVMASGLSRDIQTRTTEGDTFLLRMLPYRVSLLTTSGVILIFVDLSHERGAGSGLHAVIDSSL